MEKNYCSFKEFGDDEIKAYEAAKVHLEWEMLRGVRTVASELATITL